MNVYDFDGTLYDGDSTMDLYKYCLLRRPYIIVCLPGQFIARSSYKKGKIDRTQLKERYYRFFRYVDIEKMSRKFWDSHMDRIFDWYVDLHNDDDLVISASPEFHIKEICSRLGISEVIASQVDPRTGLYTGINCRDEEKVRRFKEVYGDADIDDFYSDSEHDLPLARLAKRAFLVKDGEITDWEME